MPGSRPSARKARSHDGPRVDAQTTDFARPAMTRLRALASSRLFGSTAVLVAAIALAFAYAWPEQGAGWNASAHFALVRSLADGTATIDPYREETGDVGWYRGHYYAAKAPGLALYSVPLWLVLERIPQIGNARDRAIWALNFWACVIPALIIFLLVRAVGDRLAPGTGLLSAIALGLGTMVLPFATMYFSHIPAAAAAFAAFALLVRERDGPFRPRTVFAAGLLAGVAVVFEYPSALIGLVGFRRAWHVGLRTRQERSSVSCPWPCTNGSSTARRPTPRTTTSSPSRERPATTSSGRTARASLVSRRPVSPTRSACSSATIAAS